MGNEMLKTMFDRNAIEPKFGKLITTNTIETDFRSFLQGRSDYLQSHPEFQSELQKLKDICLDPINRCNP
jgi:hypothetical protein